MHHIHLNFEVVKVSPNRHINLYEIFEKVKQKKGRWRLDCIILEHDEDIDWEPITKRASTEFSSKGLLPPQTSIESLLRISTRKLSDAEICVELAEVSYRYHDKIEDLGFILCKLDDPEIFLLWENMILGSR